MMEPISQRTREDCVICVLAMVMGPPYDYERVLRDSAKYRKTTADGKYLAWWESYLKDEGFQIDYRPLSELASLRAGSRGMLVFRKPLDNAGHTVAVDEHGVVDPLDQTAHYDNLDSFWEIFKLEGWGLYHRSFLAVTKPVLGQT